MLQVTTWPLLLHQSIWGPWGGLPNALEEGRKSQIILTGEKSSTYGENEHIFCDTRRSGCSHNIGLWNRVLGGIHYCCDGQQKFEWVAVRLPRRRFEQSAVVEWRVFQWEQPLPGCAVLLVQCCQRLMQTRQVSSNFLSDFFSRGYRKHGWSNLSVKNISF